MMSNVNFWNAGPRRPVGTMMCVVAFLLLCLFHLSVAYANEYRKGFLLCKDFQRSVELYKVYELDPSMEGYGNAYALCLLARDDGDDVTALNILEAHAARGNVAAADLLADYARTMGTFERVTKYDNLDAAYDATGRIIFLIDLQPDYPIGFEITEAEEQTELYAHYHLVGIARAMFWTGAAGLHNFHLLQARSYDGERDLPLYPQHAPYTLDSLERTIRNAETCASLPLKPHFNRLTYHKITTYCQMMKDIHQDMLPLERERLTLLNKESCKTDVQVCAEYDEVSQKMFALNQKRLDEEDRISDMETIPE